MASSLPGLLCMCRHRDRGPSRVRTAWQLRPTTPKLSLDAYVSTRSWSFLFVAAPSWYAARTKLSARKSGSRSKYRQLRVRANTSLAMKTDKQIQQDVLDELKWDPAVNAAEIGVTVKDGAVTLSGAVDSYGSTWAAERAAHRVVGVIELAAQRAQRREATTPGCAVRRPFSHPHLGIHSADPTQEKSNERRTMGTVWRNRQFVQPPHAKHVQPLGLACSGL